MSGSGYAQGALIVYDLISGAQQAETVRRNAELSKQIDEMNAQYAELDAYHAEQAGETRAARYQNVIDTTVGTQRSIFASQGVDVNFGTAKDLQTETKITGALNQLDIRNQAHAQALGFKRQASNLRLQGATGISQASYSAGVAQNLAVVNAGRTGVGWLSGYGKKEPPNNSDINDWEQI